MQVMTIECQGSARTAVAGKVNTQQILYVKIGERRQFSVSFQTDAEKFKFVVDHSMEKDSYQMSEMKALGECVKMAEHGDKMDESIFLKLCGKLRNSFHRVLTYRRSDVLIAQIKATRVKPAEWGSYFTDNSEVPVPRIDPSLQSPSLDWSPTTQERLRILQLRGVHDRIACDTCRIMSFSGVRHRCEICPSFNQCDACYRSHAPLPADSTHTRVHPLMLVQPQVAAQQSPSSHPLAESTPVPVARAVPVGAPQSPIPMAQAVPVSPVLDRNSRPSFGSGAVVATEHLSSSSRCVVFRGTKTKRGTTSTVALKGRTNNLF